MLLATRLFCDFFLQFPPPNNNEDDLLVKLRVHSIGLTVYCCCCCCLLIFLISLILFGLLCDISDKYINQGQPSWWPSWVNLSSPTMTTVFTSTSRSPYYASVLFLLTSLSRLYLHLSCIPNNNDDGPLMKLLLGHLIKHWYSLGVEEAFYLLTELTLMWCFWCTTLPYTCIDLQDRPSRWPCWVVNSLWTYEILRNQQMQSTHFTPQEPRKIQRNSLLLNPNISKIAGRKEIQSSVSNKVAIGNDEEDQISNEGLKETFDSCSPRSFTLAELALATNYFHQDRILGVGGFGAVYKAVLPNGQTAAVKRVSSTSNQGIKEYKAEVTIVSRSKHRHLVQLIGWCHEKKGEFLLVYELLENKSLDMHLFDPKMVSLPWSVRYKIAQGSAKALRYLHEECGQHCVLHRDFKSSNLLLDSNFEPKLSDFGLAKLVDYDKSIELSVIAGTRGYLAPECVLTGKVRTQSDVYSYGVVALELVTGRKRIIPDVAEDQQVLVKWVQNLYKARRVMEAVDPRLGDDYDKLQVNGLLIVGLWCVLHDFRERPSMSEIVRILNNAHDPLMDLKGKIPNLVPDPVPHDFDSIRETSSGFDSANGNGKPPTRGRFCCF